MQKPLRPVSLAFKLGRLVQDASPRCGESRPLTVRTPLKEWCVYLAQVHQRDKEGALTLRLRSRAAALLGIQRSRYRDRPGKVHDC